MDFYEAVYRRRTIRDFAEKDVPADTVNRILQAGLKAPTNNHLREWEFVVLRSRQSIEAVPGASWGKSTAANAGSGLSPAG